MAESENGNVPGEDSGLVDDAGSTDDTSVSNQSREGTEVPVDDTTAPAPSHGKRWLLLLLIIVALPPLGWFLSPKDMRQQWINILMNRTSPQKISSMEVTPEPAPRTVVPLPPTPPEPAPPAVVPPVLTQPPAQLSKPRMTTLEPSPSFNKHNTRPVATSEEIKALMATIHDLQNNMDVLRSKQIELSELRQQLDTGQQLELRARLRWIANPQSQLPQMARFWQDITLLTILSEDKRHEAESMRKLAADDVDQVRMWRQRLKRLAATLPVPEHPDVIPKPENPAFSWLTGRIHLRPAPTVEQQQLSQLRTRLLNISHALNVEIWPTGKTWRHLLADLREQFGDDVDLALPEHLDKVQKDITSMRGKAVNWLGEL